MTPKTLHARSGLCAAALISTLVFTFVVDGCGSSPPKRRNMKLSEASAQAAKRPEEKKPDGQKKEKKAENNKEGEPREPKKEKKTENKNEKESEYKTGDDSIEVEVRSIDVAEEPTIIEMGIDEDDVPLQELVDDTEGQVTLRPHFGLALGGGSLRGDQIDGFGVFGITTGVDFLDERWFQLAASALYITTNRTEDNSLSSGLVNEYEIGLDVTVRYYFTPRHTFMGLYAVSGGRVGYLFWDYKTDIIIEDEGPPYAITSDRLGYFAAFLGLGVNLVQVSYIHIGANLTAGIKIYSDYTRQGFENDIFDHEPLLQLIFDASFLPKSG